MSLALVDWRLPVCGVDAVRFCRTHQVDAVQLDFGGPGRAPCLDTREKQDAILEACAQYNIKITALAANRFNEIGLGSKRDRSDRRAVQHLIISILDVAKNFNVPLVFFPSFYQGLIRDQEILRETAQLLRWICQEAQDRDLSIGNENDLPVASAKQLIAEVNADNFYLIFDSYNLHKAGHSTIDFLIQMEGYFATQVHIKEDGKIKLGRGDGEITMILNQLNKYDWVEWYVLENDYRDNDITRLQTDLFWLKQQLNLP